MKKTLAEQVQALKDNEKLAWERLRNAIVKEMNAILKRMGKRELTETSLFSEDYCKAIKEQTPLMDCSIYAKVYAVVKEFDYITKLTAKWYKASADLTNVTLAIEDK